MVLGVALVGTGCAVAFGGGVATLVLGFLVIVLALLLGWET
jgi:hypothetical protein